MEITRVTPSLKSASRDRRRGGPDLLLLIALLLAVLWTQPPFSAAAARSAVVDKESSSIKVRGIAVGPDGDWLRVVRRRPGRGPFFTLLLLSHLAPIAARQMHTVFSTECDDYFDWQSLGLVYSHRKSGMPGPITRLMACDQDNYRNADLVPTYTHPPFNGYDPGARCSQSVPAPRFLAGSLPPSGRGGRIEPGRRSVSSLS